MEIRNDRESNTIGKQNMNLLFIFAAGQMNLTGVYTFEYKTSWRVIRWELPCSVVIITTTTKDEGQIDRWKQLVITALYTRVPSKGITKQETQEFLFFSLFFQKLLKLPPRKIKKTRRKNNTTSITCTLVFFNFFFDFHQHMLS